MWCRTRWPARPRPDVILLQEVNRFQHTRTHWHTGRRILSGAPADDLLVGPAKLHPLQDALRRWLDEHPEELDRLRAERPGGPLALSYRTGRRKLHPGTDRWFDSIWVSPQFEVDAVAYPYAECIAAGSDHAAVVAGSGSRDA
jgi:endonuclease/exonuclease/phosphatase family metal-dependent hydrolase